MIAGIVIAFICGIIIFGTGLGIGWNMRGSVKEQEMHKFTQIFDGIERNRWKLNELIEKVNK